VNNKVKKGIKTGVIVLVGLIVLAVLLHLIVNNLVPFIAHMHNKAGLY
jgi:galactitol-specific phosphotransferase system IIC component